VSKDKRGLRIELVPINRLKLDPRNPRLHSPRQIAQIAGSIRAFGFNVPILIDRDENVLAGHGRVAAALKRGCASFQSSVSST
jgi:ParB-like chromosome segregation protein Spo0J